MAISAANPAISVLLVLVSTFRTPDVEVGGIVRGSRGNVQRCSTPKAHWSSAIDIHETRQRRWSRRTVFPSRGRELLLPLPL